VRCLFATLLIVSLLLSLPPAALADAFKSADECVPGTRVTARDGKSGVVQSRDTTLCKVRFEDNSEKTFLFWMLKTEGASDVPSEGLRPGVYACYAYGTYAGYDLEIVDGETYRTVGRDGRYVFDAATGRIGIETGPLQGNGSKLLAGMKIGLNGDGSDFYATACER
jgi:hypothetical protein